MISFIPRPAQSEILAYTGGKMGISAVPGSGKTHTLSALAAGLIRSGILADEQEVLIVTLVNSAVDNFASRIKEFLDLPMPFGYRVRTLHGLAHDIVREKPAAVGLEERFSIIDEREAAFILREAANSWLSANQDLLFQAYIKPGLDDYQLGRIRREHLPELVTGISNAFIRSAKDQRLTPVKLAGILEQNPSPLPLASMGLSIYTDYQRALAYRGAVDFDDLIRLAIDLLEADPEFLERLRYRWPYILEDEAQDSSRLQEQILHLLTGKAGNWVRVGDPNQAIFETFTTASPRHLLDFIAHEADQYKALPNSGRSQLSIISLANHLITWVNGEHPEHAVRDALTVPFIHPAPPGDPQPNPADDPSTVKLVTNAFSPVEEVEGVVKSIERWLPDHPGSTIAVLVPRNQRGNDVIEALKLRNLDFIEFLGSTISTRKATGRLGEVVSALAEPQSPVRLAKAYLAWRRPEEAGQENEILTRVSEEIRKCPQVETYLNPKTGSNWLEDLAPGIDPGLVRELEAFRLIVRRWHFATLLPIDQMLLTLAQDLFSEQVDLALAHKLALAMRQVSDAHPEWRLPELNGELTLIARNERRFLGFSEDDSGFDPSHHPGKVVVTTMHKAKGLEWDRVYLLSLNNYDFPSCSTGDRYISEKWFVRDSLNLEAETLAQLSAALTRGEYDYYSEGTASLAARQDYTRERLRLLYVGITRARQELIMTWNTGRQGEQTPAVPFASLMEWWESQH